MFTLNFPIWLPDEHTFFDNNQYPVPSLPNGLSFGCFDHKGSPLVLRITGFLTEQDALDFCPTLRTAIRVASLDSDHSIIPSDAAPASSTEKNFDGSVPTVIPAAVQALPYYLSSSRKIGVHISVLSKLIGAALVQGMAPKVSAKPELALALELYASCQFAGQRDAQFIALMTALEILVPNNSSNGRRGAVVALVKSALAKAGHIDPKSVGKELDRLYVVRNALVHQGKAITKADLESLNGIVRTTLKALLA